MNYITTTKLRTETPELIAALMQGKSVDLIHRSEVIAEIRPKKIIKPKVFNIKEFEQIVEKLNLPKLTTKQRELNYRKAMEEKHGQRIS